MSSETEIPALAAPATKAEAAAAAGGDHDVIIEPDANPVCGVYQLTSPLPYPQ
jgi:hypothetical protein